MNKETIIENCNRLATFVKQKKFEQKIVKDNSIDELLTLFTRALDYFGAPIFGWGMIFVNQCEFLEIKEWINENKIVSIYGLNTFTFKFNSYEISIINEITN